MSADLHSLMGDASVEDIVLSPTGLSYFRDGRWHGPELGADTQPDRLQTLARYVAEQAGSTLGLTQPSVDAFLAPKEGQLFRAHVVIAPMALRGPEITLRRLPSMSRFSIESFCSDPVQAELLRRAIERRLSILVCGATGSGKTSLLTALMGEFTPETRVLILEDSPELPIPNALSSKLLARVNRFGFRSGAAWDLSHLVFESLRMRPDRMVLGECRGPEAAAISTALQTGHGGILTTLHAGSCRQGIERFRNLAAAAAPENAMPECPWDLVLHIDLDPLTKQRRVREILEVTHGTSH